MTDEQLIRCPHCGKTTILSIDATRYWLCDVHDHRKSFDELHELEIEHEYVCDKCNELYYVTLLQKIQTDKHMLIDFDRMRKYGKAKKEA